MSATTYHPFPTYAWADPDNTYLKKVKFLKAHRLPNINEIKLNIGCQLADIFFSEASDNMRQCMGMDNNLQGPREQLWVSPSDQLIGRAVLTEPYPRQEVQAMTHKNVLEIGEKLEEKFEKQKQEELEAALRKKEQEMREELERNAVARVEQIRKEMEDSYRYKLLYAKKQLNQQFKEMIEERDKAVCLKTKQKIQESIFYVRKSMAEEMQLMVNRLTAYDKERCKFQRIWDANIADEVFKKKINNLKKKWLAILNKAKRRCEYEKKQLENKLTENLSSEVEKLKKESEREIEDTLKVRTHNYRRTIWDLLMRIKKHEEEYEKLKIEKECDHVEQYSWCYLVRELLKQFQKFINYALGKKPGTAEYFLSLEKLLNSRVQSLTELEFLKKYLDEKGEKEDKEKLLADVKSRKEPLLEVREEERAKQEYPCLPEDVLAKREKKKREEEYAKHLADIQVIIDKMLKKAVPKFLLKDMPCIDSELWSSAKSEENMLRWPSDPKPPGLKIAGEGVAQENWTAFIDDRVKSLIRVLNKNPRLKLAIVGNS